MKLIFTVFPEQSDVSSTLYIRTSIYYSEYLIFFALCEKFFFFLQSTVLISKPKECEINVVLHTNNAEYKRTSTFRVSLRYQVCFLCKWLMPSRRNNNYMAQGGGKKACWVIQAFSQNITETPRKKNALELLRLNKTALLSVKWMKIKPLQ